MGISIRAQVAQNLADTCVFGGLNDSHEVCIEKETDTKGKSYWSVSFSKDKNVDGNICVFGERHIVVKWKSLKTKSQETFKNETLAKSFMVSTFVVE
jgi:hypothetical protein